MNKSEYFILITSCVLGFSGALSSYMKRLYDAELVSHSMLPGALIGIFATIFLNKNEQETQMYFAVMFSFFYVVLMVFSRPRAQDTSSAIVRTSGSFGIACILTRMMKEKFPVYASLPSQYINGNMTLVDDRALFAALALLCIYIVFLFVSCKRIQSILIDESFIRKCGSSVEPLLNISMILIIVSIVIGILSEGIVLTSTFLIVPFVCSKLSARGFSQQIYLSGFIGFVLSAVCLHLSSILMNFLNIETASIASMISVIACFLVFLFVLFGTNSPIGIWNEIKMFNMRVNRAKEDCLMMLLNCPKYKIRNKDIFIRLGAGRIAYRVMMRSMIRENLVSNSLGRVKLTKKGILFASKIMKKHEYLESKLKNELMLSNIDAHDVADELEHYYKHDNWSEDV